MKLTELHPEFGTTGIDGRFFLTFDCPKTPGCKVFIQFHRDRQLPGIWQCTSPWKVFPGLEHLGEQPVLEQLSLIPSIGDHHYKRMIRCFGHVNITNGEVVASK
jgi:hypothetical protein